MHGRGLYCTLPVEEGSGEGQVTRRHWNDFGIHVDDCACHLMCVGFIDDSVRELSLSLRSALYLCPCLCEFVSVSGCVGARRTNKRFIS